MDRNRRVLLGAVAIVIFIVLLAVFIVFLLEYAQKYFQVNYGVDPFAVTVLLAFATFLIVYVLFKRRVPE